MNLEKLDKIIHEDFNDAIIGKYIFYHKTRTVYKDDESVIYILFFTEGLAIIQNKVEEIIKPENIKDVEIRNKYIKLNYKITHKKKLKIHFKNQELMERSFKLIKDVQNLIQKTDKKPKIRTKIKPKKESKIETTKSLRNKTNIMMDTQNESIIDRILNEEPKIKDKTKITKKNEENKTKKNEKEHIKSKFNLIDHKKHILSQHQINFKTKEKEDIFFKLEFNDLRFFISAQQSIEHLKMKAIARIGKYFFPEKQIIDKMIDLNQYKEFRFFIKENKKLYQLEIEEDLNAIIKNLGNKFNVIIKLR